MGGVCLWKKRTVCLSFSSSPSELQTDGETFQDDRGDEGDADADDGHDADDHEGDEGGEGAGVRCRFPFTNLLSIIINDHRLNFAC